MRIRNTLVWVRNFNAEAFADAGGAAFKTVFQGGCAAGVAGLGGIEFDRAYTVSAVFLNLAMWVRK